MGASRCFVFGSSLGLKVLETGLCARLRHSSCGYEHAWKVFAAAVQ